MLCCALLCYSMLCTAAGQASKRYGIRGVGIEYDSALCDKARAKAAQEGVQDQVSAVQEGVQGVD